MSIDYYIARRGDGPWGDIEMRFELYADHLTATEMRRNPRTEAELEGRTIIIYNTVKFLRALGIKSETDFDRYMENLADSSKLDIDLLQRRCEYNGIRYELSGTRLQTVWRKYIKECRTKLSEVIDLLRSEPDEVNEAIEFLMDAADVNLPEAFGHVAVYFADGDYWVMAHDYASRGAELKDPLSMYILGRYYTECKHDYTQAVKWCVKAAEKGIPQAVELINRLINSGKIDPGSVQYSALLAAYARIINSDSNNNQ